MPVMKLEKREEVEFLKLMPRLEVSSSSDVNEKARKDTQFEMM